jgi:hypothetical protein
VTVARLKVRLGWYARRVPGSELPPSVACVALKRTHATPEVTSTFMPVRSSAETPASSARLERVKLRPSSSSSVGLLGATVSSTIDAVRMPLTLFIASRYWRYTTFVPSPDESVKGMLVGVTAPPNATKGTPLSVGSASATRYSMADEAPMSRSVTLVVRVKPGVLLLSPSSMEKSPCTRTSRKRPTSRVRPASTSTPELVAVT